MNIINKIYVIVLLALITLIWIIMIDLPQLNLSMYIALSIVTIITIAVSYKTWNSNKNIK